MYLILFLFRKPTFVRGVVRASASQSVVPVLGLLSLSDHTEDFKDSSYSYPACRSARKD